ncbi:Rha family transcriptional regulator [Ruminococcaceae bacterium OttesenSCG-928-L11]|nr:Rha family transcriptional regulator [Ruminococcaceae bacterium OttesenSCG-928-L11]
MYDLTVIKQNGGAYLDSREVAEMIGKKHNHLLRDIRSYVEVIKESGASNFGHSDFFVPATYQSEQNKVMPCYLISKMGCEVIGNKLTGEKGVLFTCAYVRKFNEMEQRENAKLETLITLVPPRWYRAGEIAAHCGLYSLYGNPHAQAVSRVLNEILFIGAEHKRVIRSEYSENVLYDNYALCEVVQWLADCDFPDEIYSFDRTYHVQYTA